MPRSDLKQSKFTNQYTTPKGGKRQPRSFECREISDRTLVKLMSNKPKVLKISSSENKRLLEKNWVAQLPIETQLARIKIKLEKLKEEKDSLYDLIINTDLERLRMKRKREFALPIINKQIEELELLAKDLKKE